MIDKVNAKLVPGKDKGDAKLTLDIKTAKEIEILLLINNHRSPSIGSLNGALSLTHKNLFGNAERLDVEVGLTRATNDIVGSEGAFNYNAKLTLPVNSLDLDFFINANRCVSAVIIEPLIDLDIESTST
ncbi:MAG: hypothetical protein JKY42_03930, partial [Flavobacteriales bacterium]|nr:hypothetical protein [Flavobacteriales bacterium]